MSLLVTDTRKLQYSASLAFDVGLEQVGTSVVRGLRDEDGSIGNVA